MSQNTADADPNIQVGYNGNKSLVGEQTLNAALQQQGSFYTIYRNLISTSPRKKYCRADVKGSVLFNLPLFTIDVKVSTFDVNRSVFKFQLSLRIRAFPDRLSPVVHAIYLHATCECSSVKKSAMFRFYFSVILSKTWKVVFRIMLTAKEPLLAQIDMNWA